MTADDVRRIVTESRAAQGLPPTVEDPAAVAKVARLLRTVEPSPCQGREAA